MKNSAMNPEIAIISGTGLEKLAQNPKKIHIGTPYGIPPALFLGEMDAKPIAFVSRHGTRHETPPHRINHHANIHALWQLGVKRIIATNAVGAANTAFKPTDIVIAHDFIDFSGMQPTTFYDHPPVTHVDMSQPYCPTIRRTLIQAGKRTSIRVTSRGVMACTTGPRLETPAEVEMLRRWGADLVGMTGAAEAVLSRELEMCYACVCFVVNLAAGTQKRLGTNEVMENAEKARPRVEKLLSETVRTIPRNRKCPCVHALEDARF